MFFLKKKKISKQFINRTQIRYKKTIFHGTNIRRGLSFVYDGVNGVS